MGNPVRFEKGVNSGVSRQNPLARFLNAPAQIGQWGVYFTDFSVLDGWISDQQGAGSATIAESATVSSSFREFGILDLATAGTGSDRSSAYPSSGTTDVPAAGWSFAAGVEWVFSTRLRLSNLAQGFHAGWMTAGDIVSAGVPVDYTSNPPPVAGFLFRKAVGTAAIVADWYSAGVALMAQQTMVAAGAAARAYQMTAHHKGGLLELFLSEASTTVLTHSKIASVQVNWTVASILLGGIISCKEDSAAVRHVYADNYLLAVKTDR